MTKEYFIARTTKSDLDNLITIYNGDGSGLKNLKKGKYESVCDSEYFNLKKGEVYEFCEERAGGVILKLIE